MADNTGPPKDTFWKDLGTYGTLGINLAVTVGAGFYIGLKLDQRYDTAPRWILTGFFFGLCVGLYTLFALAAKFGKHDE